MLTVAGVAKSAVHVSVHTSVCWARGGSFIFPPPSLSPALSLFLSLSLSLSAKRTVQVSVQTRVTAQELQPELSR